jgi:hypothetical protein
MIFKMVQCELLHNDDAFWNMRGFDDAMIARPTAPMSPTGDTSIAAPALASHNGKLFMAWTATDGVGSLNIMPSTDGGFTFQTNNKHFVETRDPQGRVNREKSIAAPALISYRGLLLIAWTGTDGRGMLNIATSADEGGLTRALPR